MLRQQYLNDSNVDQLYVIDNSVDGLNVAIVCQSHSLRMKKKLKGGIVNKSCTGFAFVLNDTWTMVMNFRL